MAVLEAVRGWEVLAGLEHINDVKKDGGEATDGGEETKIDDAEEENDEEEGLFTEEELEKEIGQLLDTDHISLLLEHEKHMNAPSKDSICECCCDYLSYRVEYFLQYLIYHYISPTRYFLNMRLLKIPYCHGSRLLASSVVQMIHLQASALLFYCKRD
jgi:hypothetical protein